MLSGDTWTRLPDWRLHLKASSFFDKQTMVPKTQTAASWYTFLMFIQAW